MWYERIIQRLLSARSEEKRMQLNPNELHTCRYDLFCVDYSVSVDLFCRNLVATHDPYLCNTNKRDARKYTLKRKYITRARTCTLYRVHIKSTIIILEFCHLYFIQNIYFTNETV